MASLDIHIEAPPDKYWHKRRTHYDVDTERSRVRLSKSIPGRYHDGHADYDEVGVLLITWKDDDMYCKEKEVGPTLALRRRQVEWLMLPPPCLSRVVLTLISRLIDFETFSKTNFVSTQKHSRYHRIAQQAHFA
jgi:hypothetical protein